MVIWYHFIWKFSLKVEIVNNNKLQKVLRFLIKASVFSLFSPGCRPKLSGKFYENLPVSISFITAVSSLFAKHMVKWDVEHSVFNNLCDVSH